MRVEQRAFALKRLYVYPRLKLAYSYIPKNACTSFKRTLGRAQGWLSPDAKSSHEMTVAHWMYGLSRYPASVERFVVLRNPFDRILSGYLNRFLLKDDRVANHAMRSGLAESLGPDGSIQDVTFAHFVEYLSRTPSRSLNAHWRPQCDFLIGTYTRYIRFEHLADDTAFLARHGLVLEDARGHATSTRQQDVGPGWGSRSAAQLRRLRNSQGILPTRENMYDESLRAMIADRYARDVELFRSDGHVLPG